MRGAAKLEADALLAGAAEQDGEHDTGRAGADTIAREPCGQPGNTHAQFYVILGERDALDG